MYLFLIFFQTLFFYCSENTGKKNLSLPKSEYDFSTPDKVYKLPGKLDEISGLAYISKEEVACIEDETGDLFTYNLKEEKIMQEFPFEKKGDYEDIVKVKDIYYVLKSNGTLYEISNGLTIKYSTPLTRINNTEGLCYDRLNNRLLISCKQKPKEIYSFDLKTKSFNQQPIFAIEIKKFAPTAICLDNSQKHLLVLADHDLAVYTTEGVLQDLIHLNPELFPQAEGITINENGDLLISNEAHGREATILQFKNRKA
jgi:uncharacterized protein YjiK